MPESVFLTIQVEKVSTEDILKMADERDFKTRRLVFPSQELRKQAQSTTSWININKLRQIGLNLTTKTDEDNDKALFITLGEYNNG